MDRRYMSVERGSAAVILVLIATGCPSGPIAAKCGPRSADAAMPAGAINYGEERYIPTPQEASDACTNLLDRRVGQVSKGLNVVLPSVDITDLKVVGGSFKFGTVIEARTFESLSDSKYSTLLGAKLHCANMYTSRACYDWQGMEPQLLFAERLLARAELGSAYKDYLDAPPDEMKEKEKRVRKILQDAAAIAEPPDMDAPRPPDDADDAKSSDAPVTTGQLRQELGIVEASLREALRKQQLGQQAAFGEGQRRLRENVNTCLRELNAAQQRVSRTRSEIRNRLGSSQFKINVSEVFEPLRVELAYSKYDVCQVAPPAQLKRALSKINSEALGGQYSIKVKAFHDGDALKLNGRGVPSHPRCKDAKIEGDRHLVQLRGDSIASLLGRDVPAEPVMDEFLCEPEQAKAHELASCYSMNRRVELIVDGGSANVNLPEACGSISEHETLSLDSGAAQDSSVAASTR